MTCGARTRTCTPKTACFRQAPLCYSTLSNWGRRAETNKQRWAVQMLQRNAVVKRAPQRWQDCREQFDVAVTFEERILEQLLDGANSQAPLALAAVILHAWLTFT